MAKSSATRNNFLQLLFNGTAWAFIADNAATTPATNFYVALHTGDPGIAGTQATSECTYTGYDRITSPRTSGEWTVTANSVSNTTELSFPIASAGSETATYASIGMDDFPTAGIILYSGALSPSIVITTGVTPVITLASTITET